jgi:hypothetical protein
VSESCLVHYAAAVDHDGLSSHKVACWRWQIKQDSDQVAGPFSRRNGAFLGQAFEQFGGSGLHNSKVLFPRWTDGA